MKRLTFAALSCIALLLPSSADAQIKWSVAPYVWSANITRRVDIEGIDVIDRTTTANSLLDKTDFAFMGYFEGRGERYGAFADISFLNLGAERETVVITPAIGPNVAPTIETDMKLTFYDLVGFIRPAGGDEGLDVYLGVRVADIDQKFDIVYPGNVPSTRVLQIDESLMNGIAGLRYSMSFTDKWDLAGRADAGAGDAKFTWNAQVTAGYWFGDSRIASARFGWRYTEMKFENDEGEDGQIQTDSKLELSGPLVGVLFRF